MRYTLCVIAMILPLCLIGCNDDISGSQSQDGGTVAGVVSGAASGLPLPGVTVSVTPGGYSVVTDLQGLYHVSTQDAGQCTLRVTKAGYRDSTFTVTLSADSVVVRHLSMEFVPPQAGLLADYLFDGGAIDGSGNGFHGTTHGTTVTGDRFGKSGAALHLDGRAYIDLGADTALNFLHGFTVTAWIKDTAGSGTQGILTRWDMVNGVDERTYSLGTRNADHPYLLISRDGTDAGSVITDAPVAVKAYEWVFIAATYDHAMMKLFVDGVMVSSIAQHGITYSPNTRTAIGATIGRIGDPVGYMFQGSIDGMRIYNRPLNLSEIEMLYDEK